MRFMMFMYPEITDEEWGPTAENVEAMGRYNDELRKAGLLLSLDGLRPPGEGARVAFDAEGEATVTDGPYAEAKELVGGYWLIQAGSRQEAVEWARRCPGRACTVEVRQVFDIDDFPEDVQEAYERADPGAAEAEA
ncbi:MAG: YciI family protein [Solirubrobacterales bacterium]